MNRITNLNTVALFSAKNRQKLNTTPSWYPKILIESWRCIDVDTVLTKQNIILMELLTLIIIVSYDKKLEFAI